MGYLRRVPHRLGGLVLFLPSLFLFAVGRVDLRQLKSALIHHTLGGSSRSDIDAWTAQFVERLRLHGVFAEALERIAQHKREGARLVLLSAATDLYVPAIARALGFHEAICTGVRWNGNSLDGHLSTPNLRGVEKTRCFERLRSLHPGQATAAYGNEAADLDHLRLADQPLLVNGFPGARREAARLGIPCARWH